ncbi:hypothetical protein WA158_008335 [Blastocystis sp. Blastoise]
MTRVSFSLTHFMYEDSNPFLGKVMSIVSLAPIFVIVMYCSEILLHREIETCFLLIGQLINLFINIFLKLICDMPRPDTALQHNNGMPSDHMQFMCFFAVYMTFFLLKRCKFIHRWMQYVAVLFIYVLTIIIFFSRLYLGEHFLDQLIVGSILGLINGSIWYYLNYHYFVHWYSTICSTKLFTLFQFKDYSNIPDVLTFEYDNCKKQKKN